MAGRMLHVLPRIRSSGERGAVAYSEHKELLALLAQFAARATVDGHNISLPLPCHDVPQPLCRLLQGAQPTRLICRPCSCCTKQMQRGRLDEA